MTEKLIAFDFGSTRIGVAVALGELVFARPAIAAKDAAENAAQLVLEEGCDRVFVGFPLLLSGLEGTSAQQADDFAHQLSKQLAKPVFLVDERFTTSLADRQLRELPLSGKQRRRIVDSAAAAQLLQHILNSEAANSNQTWRSTSG